MYTKFIMSNKYRKFMLERYIQKKFSCEPKIYINLQFQFELVDIVQLAKMVQIESQIKPKL